MTGQRHAGSKIQKFLNLTLAAVAYKPLPRSWFNTVYKKSKGMVSICYGKNEWPWWNGYQRSCTLLTGKTSVFSSGAFIQELMNKGSWYLSTTANSGDRISLHVTSYHTAFMMLLKAACLQTTLCIQDMQMFDWLLTWSYHYHISVIHG